MSKAFTKEGDEPEVVLEPRPLPPGTINYMTRAGYERLRASLVESPPGPRAAAMARRLDTAVIVDPEPGAARVAFGCTVDVVGDAGARSYMIVGIDEVDERAGSVSWLSPIGRALVGAVVGDVVVVETPRGELELEVVAIR